MEAALPCVFLHQDLRPAYPPHDDQSPGTWLTPWTADGTWWTCFAAHSQCEQLSGKAFQLPILHIKVLLEHGNGPCYCV